MTIPGIHHVPSDNTNPLNNHLAPKVSTQTKIQEGRQTIPVPAQTLASEATLQKHTLGPLGQYSTPQILSTLKKEKIGVEKLFAVATVLGQDEEIMTRQVIDKISAGAIEKIIREGLAADGTAIASPVAVYTKDLDLSREMQPYLIEEGFIRELPELELAVVGTNILSRGSIIFTSGMLLNKIEEAIEAKEQYLASVVDETERKAIQQEIIVLKKWVKVRLSIISSSMIELAYNAAVSSPKALSAIVVLAKATGTVVSSVIEWVGLGVGLICAAVSFHSSRINLKTHDVWTALIGIKGEGDAIDDVDQKRKVNVDAIIERQKKVFAARFETNYPDLTKRLRSVLPDLDVTTFSNENKQPEDVVLEKLSEAGITLSEISDAVKDLKQKEMLSVSLRKGLLAFNQKKDQIDKGFLQQAVIKYGGLLALSSVMTSAVIVLKTLLIVGVIASTVALTAVGYGMLGLVIGTIIFGAVYLYIKKPNIFKTYVQGVQAQLLFWNIPMAIQSFRSHYAQLEEMRVSDQIYDIRGRVLEAEGLLNGEKEDIHLFLSKHLPQKITSGLNVDIILKKYLKKLKKTEAAKLKEAELLKIKISGLNESITKVETKLKPLQEQVAIAGWKDFQLSLNRKEGELKLEGGKYVTKAKSEDDSKDDASILADYLVQDIGLQEHSETRKLLLHMDIDPHTLSEKDSELLKEMLAERIRAFFAMETDETLGMIKKQNLLVKHGLRENIADS